MQFARGMSAARTIVNSSQGMPGPNRMSRMRPRGPALLAYMDAYRERAS